MSWPTWIPPLIIIAKSWGCFQKCQLSTFETSCKSEKQNQVKLSNLNPFFHKYTTLVYGFYGLSFSWIYKQWSNNHSFASITSFQRGTEEIWIFLTSENITGVHPSIVHNPAQGLTPVPALGQAGLSGTFSQVQFGAVNSHPLGRRKGGTEAECWSSRKPGLPIRLHLNGHKEWD